MGFAALAAGVGDKARLQISERLFRPAALQHEPLRQRLRAQMVATLQRLEKICAARGDAEWLFGDSITQADVTLACAMTYASETVGLPVEEAALPAMRARHARLEQLPAFREIYLAFDAPVIS
jgi:glutathione S-transferase